MTVFVFRIGGQVAVNSSVLCLVSTAGRPAN